MRSVGGRRCWYAAGALGSVLLGACGQSPAPPGSAAGSGAPGPAARVGEVCAERLARAAEQPGQWLTGGGGPDEAYFSRLTQINADNVRALGFAWDYRLGTARGLEATPVVVDGTLFTTGNWGRVYALDAATGRERWTFVPNVDPQWSRFACCDVVNRGLAVWQGAVYVGALDGWLYALDAATGRILWRVDTLIGRAQRLPYTSTGAPLLAGQAVVIGNGGGDFAGVRGYVSAYELKTGSLLWRFFTVPRNPTEGPQDQPHLAAAVKTWDRRHRWEAGSGGTVWDGMAYDSALDLVYVGTGNGSPYDIREGGRRGGDDLYTAAIVAINAKDGSLAWYYQTTPADRWDFDADAKFVLADLTLGGRPRQVLMQANKNGFYYVLDRATGEVLSAQPYAFVNWTRGIDPVTHRPRPSPAADYKSGPKLIFPGMSGAHNWQPMAFDSRAGIAYIPALEAPMVYIDTDRRPAGLVEGMFTVPGITPEGYDPRALKNLMGPLPELVSLAKGIGAPAVSRGALRAFDVVRGRILWEQLSPTSWDGGVLATAGKLVFQGDALGQLSIYAADSGQLLHRVDLGTSVMAAPMSYSVGGQQFVALMAGYGGGNLAVPLLPESAAVRYGNAGRIIALKLNGGPIPKPRALEDPPFPEPPPRPAAGPALAAGEILYNRYCSRCHIFARSVLPDLRRMAPATHRLFYDIVLGGVYGAKGMARWDDVLSRADVEAIHAYLIDQAWQVHSPAHPAGLVGSQH
jgi:quinohemoprotein ethanol dehydrogenase